MYYEDEEVVMCHSPLDQYLEEVTDESFVKYSPVPSHVQNDNVSNVVKVHSNNDLQNNLRCLANKYIPGNLTDTFDVVHSCSLLLNSSLLCEEDEKLLIDLSEEVQNLTKVHECAGKGHNIFMNKGVRYGIFVVIIGAFLGFLLKLKCMNDVLTGIITLGLIFPLLYYVKIKEFMKNIPNDILINVQLFSDVFGNYNRLIDKVIRHIRETEVITQGYSQINMFNSSLPRNGEKCLRLRCCLNDGLTDLFNQLRVNARIILGNKRNEMIFDYKEEHIAVMPLDTFSEVLYSSGERTDQIDFTPLGKLKAIACLYRLQMSEYVYLVITSLFTFHHDNVKKYAKDVLFSLEDLNRSISNISKLLEEQLNVSLKLIFHKVEDIPEKKIQNVRSAEDVLHSSHVHLHAALGRIEDMKILFQQKSSNSKEVPLDVLNSLASQFNLSLENAKFCIEEIVENSQPDIDETDFPPIKNNDLIDEDEENYILLPRQPVDLGDLLYEGESECNISNRVQCSTDIDIENSLKESRESRKLMRELKTILSVKESPVGLMSFPLKRRTSNEHSDTEYSCGEEVIVKKAEERRSYNSAYVYDPGSSDDEHNVALSLPMMQQIGLPAFSRMCNMEEVAFGSSTDEEPDHVISEKS